MKRIVGIAAVLVFAGLVWGILELSPSEDPKRDTEPSITLDAQPATRPPETLEGQPTTRDPFVARTEEKVSRDLVFTACCVDADGRPVAAVACILSGSRRDPATHARESREEVRTETQADGTLRLQAPFREGFDAAITFDEARFVRYTHAFGATHAGMDVSLGDVPLVRGATVRGQLLERDETPITTGWSVRGRTKDAHLEVATRLETAADDAHPSHRFEFTRVIPGTWRFEATAGTSPMTSVDVELSPGETRDIVITRREETNPFDSIVLAISVPSTAPERRYVSLIAPDGQRLEPSVDRSGRLFAFHDLDDGPVEARIDDPRYEPWSQRGVRPGPRPILVELRGTSAVRLHVVEEGTGRPLERFALAWLEYRSSAGSMLMASTRMEIIQHDAGVAEVPGLASGTHVFRLLVPGYDETHPIVENLAIGESRDLTIALPPKITVAGTVKWEGSGAPVPRAKVSLFAPAAVDDGPHSTLMPGHLLGEMDRTWRTEEHATHADEQGRFVLESVPAGRWIPAAMIEQARGNSMLELAAPMEFRTSTDTLRLRLPQSGTYLVHTLWPPTPPYDLSFRITPHQRPALQQFVVMEHRLTWWEPALRVEPLAPGTYDVTVSLIAHDTEHATAQSGFALGPIEIQAGETTESMIDLEALLPGSLHVRFLVDGQPLSTKAQVLLTHVEGTPDWDVVLTDERGEVSFPALFPGTKRLVLRGSEFPWIYEPEPLLVAKSTSNERTVLVPLSTRRIVFRDRETQRPIARMPIAIVPETTFELGGTRRTLQTDAEGAITLQLVAGSYSVSVGLARTDAEPVGARESTTFTWPLAPDASVLLHVPR